MYDALIIIMLISAFFLGMKRGFVRTAYSMFSLVVSSVIVYFLYNYFLSYFAVSEVGKTISNYVSSSYNGIFSEQISALAVSAAALLVLYFIVKLVLKFLIGILDLISKLPIINTLNKFLGGIIGVAIGAILVVIITNIAFAIPAITPHIEASKIVEATDILMITIN